MSSTALCLFNRVSHARKADDCVQSCSIRPGMPSGVALLLGETIIRIGLHGMMKMRLCVHEQKSAFGWGRRAHALLNEGIVR